MRQVLDFEIHSKYSRACSQDLNILNIAAWASRKGVDIIGSGDFTHPKWFAEIEQYLTEQDNGLLVLKKEFRVPAKRNQPEAASGSPSFILSAEISSIYRHKDKTRRIHNILLAPSIAAVKEIIRKLEAKGAKLGSDGRPITGLHSKDLLTLILEVSENCALIPAHVWTPYFGLFGSMSGYDSVEECFEDMAEYIFALETGLSADPEMFWRISKLDRYALVSCSDAHSLPRIARECNVLEIAPNNLSYQNILQIIKAKSHLAAQKDFKKPRGNFLHTLEYYPEEGRYHYDGHAQCGLALHPSKTARLPKNFKGQALCPKCGLALTIGVLSRAAQLADRVEGFIKANAVAAKHFVMLEEIIAASYGVGVSSKKVQQEYMRLTNQASELDILLELDNSQLLRLTSVEVVAAILKMRAGNLKIEPGYDGVYGKVKLIEKPKKQKILPRSLFD